MGAGLDPVAAYVASVVLALALLAVFFLVYTRVTPYDEIHLIRQGNAAAACSLSGAMFGFGLTVVGSIISNSTLLAFLGWAAGAMVLQLTTYAFLARVLTRVREGIEGNNVAMGAFMGAISVTVGAVNAASLS
jgi:putative membrane protein